MEYDEWLRGVSVELTQDPLWKLQVYRKALFLSHVCWQDAQAISQTSLLRDLATQLLRAADAISANIAEGYGHSTGKNKARFYEYALGSAREARDWYYKAQRTLPPDLTAQRMALLTEIIKMLNALIPRQRQRGLREPTEEYLP